MILNPLGWTAIAIAKVHTVSVWHRLAACQCGCFFKSLYLGANSHSFEVVAFAALRLSFVDNYQPPWYSVFESFQRRMRNWATWMLRARNLIAWDGSDSLAHLAFSSRTPIAIAVGQRFRNTPWQSQRQVSILEGLQLYSSIC